MSLSFAEDCTPVVPCFTGKLVQANLENIRDFKDGLDGDHTTGVANFSAALNTAFDILEKHLPPNAPAESTSSCNQGTCHVTWSCAFNHVTFIHSNHDNNGRLSVQFRGDF